MHPELFKVAQETGYKNLKSMLFLHHLVKNVDPDYVLELGTWKGCSCAFMASAIKDSGTVISIDNNNQLRQMNLDVGTPKKNLERCGVLQKTKLLEGSTHSSFLVVHRFFPKVNPTIFFLDADHSYTGIKKEFLGLRTLVPKEHIIVLDDLFSPVLKFATELVPRYPFSLMLKDFHQGIAVFCTNQDYLLKVVDAVEKSHD